MERNSGCAFDLNWINKVTINTSAVEAYAKQIKNSKNIKDEYQIAWLLKIITLIDLTSLSADDTTGRITRLCHKASSTLPEDFLSMYNLIDKNGFSNNSAAVCVYPTKVKDAVTALKSLGFYDKINVASVASGFPHGQTFLAVKLEEIRQAVEQGANEIDIVIDRSLVLMGKWEELYCEVEKLKSACGTAHLKTILATGELGNLTNVYKASLVAMMAGSDFIKTSTGKESVNATIPYGIVMAWAIKDFFFKVGYKVGLKPAGGISTSLQAIEWIIMIKEILGNEWLTPQLFRFGASSLVNNIELSIYKCVTQNDIKSSAFTMG